MNICAFIDYLPYKLCVAGSKFFL